MFATKQELFDAVATALLKQGKPAFNEETGACVYRADDGCKCAVGGLIPDALYEPGMEGKLVYQESMMGKVIRKAAGIPFKMRMFAWRLQEAHDTAACSSKNPNNESWVQDWRQRMVDIAATNSLDASVLNESTAA